MKKSSTLFIGLDVHMESIVISLVDDHNGKVRQYGKIGGCRSDFNQINFWFDWYGLLTAGSHINVCHVPPTAQ